MKSIFTKENLIEGITTIIAGALTGLVLLFYLIGGLVDLVIKAIPFLASCMVIYVFGHFALNWF